MNELKDITFQIQEISKNANFAKYKISIQVPMSIGWIENMKFNIESNGEINTYQLAHIKNDNDLVYFEREIDIPTKALYHYYFSMEANNKFLYFKKNNQDNYTRISKEDMWKLSVNFKAPDWAKGKIMYHVFLDRFNKERKDELKEMPNRTIHKNWDDDMIIGPNENGLWNADFYGGDLKGIEKKLDYIKSLGVSIIYISPIVWSQSNHRYDSSDFEKVDPYAGCNEDLKDLCDAAHEKGMKVILDAVFNHTGNDSKYFNEYGNFDELGAYQSPESKYYSFYRKYNSPEHTYFDYWWGMKNLPVCDGNSKEWQDYIYGEGGIIDLWFSLGIDGLRLDVADELTDEFIEGIRRAVKRNKEDGFILGEVWKNPMRMGRGYIESGRGMDSVMDYVLVDALIRYFKYSDTNKLKDVIYQLKTEYPTDTLLSLMNFTSTHDISRAINIFGTDEFNYFGEWAWDLNNNNRDYQKNYQMSPEQYQRGKDLYELYLYTLTFMPGILSIFYGDEVGVQGLGNLCNRKPFPWGMEDKDLLRFVQMLGDIRRKESFLENADFEVLDLNDSYFLFERKNINEEALVMVNRLDEKIDIKVPNIYNNPDQIYSLKNSSLGQLGSHGALVLKKKR